MNKKSLFLVLFLISWLVFVPSVLAIGSKVMVMKLNYDHGNVTLLNSTIKYGFSPDRRYQPEEGYKLKMTSFGDEKLYEFRFKMPNEIFIDGTDSNGEISGGKIVLDNINFALVVPYYDDMKEIKIYSKSDEIVGEISFEEQRNFSIMRGVLVGLIAIITAVLLIFIFVKHSKQ